MDLLKPPYLNVGLVNHKQLNCAETNCKGLEHIKNLEFNTFDIVPHIIKKLSLDFDTLIVIYFCEDTNKIIS